MCLLGHPSRSMRTPSSPSRDIENRVQAVSDAHADGGRTERPAESADEHGAPPRSRLPARQPARAAVVVLAYLLAVSAVTWPLQALYGTLGLICAGFFAAASTVAVAVLAPRPRAAEQEAPDPRPVLLRNVPTRAARPETARSGHRST